MTTLNNAIRLLQTQIRDSQPALLTSFGAAPYHPGAPTLPAPVVPALLVHGGLNKNDLHDPTVPVAVQVVLQSDMFENDDLTLYLGTTAVAAETLRQEHLDSGIVTFYLAPSVFPQEGPVTLHYHHFVPMSSAYTVSHDVGPFLVKQTVPGDPDPDPLTPYINERLTPITGIPDPVPPGQPLTVTVPRYAHISAGDRLVVYISSEEVSTIVTPEQASNPNLSLTVTIPASVIDRTPGIGLIVRYDIHDTVKNWSLYSMEARVDVIPPGALHAPTVRDANDYDELDMDDLDGADVAILIPVNGNLPLGTDGVLTWTGLPVIGPRLTYTQSFKIERAATRITLYVPNAKAAALVDSTATVYYEATLNGVSTPSQRVSVQVVGEPVTLEKPTLTGISGDTYNPAQIIGTHQEVVVPAYGFMARGQSVILHWEGRTASGSPLYVQERKELTSDTPQDVSFLIDKVFATVLGTNTMLKAYYEIIADGVTYASPKLELTIVGVPSNLPKPTTEPVFANGEIDPDTVTDAIKVVVEPNSTLAPGDLLTVKWLGRSGASIILNEQVFPSSGNLEIRIGKSPYIDGNADAYVDVSYEARRNGQPVGSSQVLQLHVGEAAEQPWPLPTLIDATNGQVSTWQPVKPGTQFDTNTATVVISDPRIQQHDIVAMVWRLPDQTDLTIPWLDVQTAGEASVAIPQDVLAKSLGKPVLVVGVVFRDGVTIGSTAPTNFQIGTVPASALSELIIVEAANNGAGLEFDVSTQTSATIRMGTWPLIGQGQPVWLTLEGDNGEAFGYVKRIWQGGSDTTNANWVSNRFMTVPVTPFSELQELRDGSILRVTFKVGLAGSGSTEAQAVTFAERDYVLRAEVDIKPVISSVRDQSGEVANGGDTYHSPLILTGTAKPDQKVQIWDGSTNKGEATANTAGIWTFSLAWTELGVHSITAKALYGKGSTSSAWQVVAKVVPFVTEDFERYAIGQSLSNGEMDGMNFSRVSGYITSEVIDWHPSPPYVVGKNYFISTAGWDGVVKLSFTKAFTSIRFGYGIIKFSPSLTLYTSKSVKIFDLAPGAGWFEYVGEPDETLSNLYFSLEINMFLMIDNITLRLKG